jgi:two-component system, sensor histidine kinase and response regulator
MNNSSILIIDDEPNNFEVIETLLAGDDYDLYYANSGADALADISKFNPDLILLDLTMPKMDGLEVCERLRLMRKWKSLPIIMVTASSSKSTLSSCLEAGADDFISKPVDKIELRARIKSMLRIKKQFDRIESLIKLQQQNITLLENELGQIGCDLAVGFANELTTPIDAIAEGLTTVSRKIEHLKRSEILDLVNNANRSATEIKQLTNKFWTYLELAIEKKQFHNNETANLDKIIKQIVTIQSRLWQRETDVKIDLDIAHIQANDRHCEWMVKELLYYAIHSSLAGTPIEINGRSSDKVCTLSITSTHPNLTETEIVPIEEGELGLGLKIVKKITNIYDGSFEISTVASLADRSDITMRIKLPVARVAEFDNQSQAG